MQKTVEVFGDFLDSLPSCPEQLVLNFSPSNAPPQKRWRNNGLSADFLADYLVTCLSPSEEGNEVERQQAEIKDSVSFIANELLENSMKFSDTQRIDSTQIKLYFDIDRILFITQNSICPETARTFQQYIQKIMDSDPEELYINQLEENAENHRDSGLGLLTMLNDYSARLGWKFEQDAEHQDNITVTTMVQLPMETSP